jgi:hypothetical protein
LIICRTTEYNINLGLKVRASYCLGSRVKVYDTPDAAELARRLNPGILGRATIVPTRIDLYLCYDTLPPPEAGVGGGFGYEFGGGIGGGGGCSIGGAGDCDCCD